MTKSRTIRASLTIQTIKSVCNVCSVCGVCGVPRAACQL